MARGVADTLKINLGLQLRYLLDAEGDVWPCRNMDPRMINGFVGVNHSFKKVSLSLSYGILTLTKLMIHTSGESAYFLTVLYVWQLCVGVEMIFSSLYVYGNKLNFHPYNFGANPRPICSFYNK